MAVDIIHCILACCFIFVNSQTVLLCCVYTEGVTACVYVCHNVSHSVKKWPEFSRPVTRPGVQGVGKNPPFWLAFTETFDKLPYSQKILGFPIFQDFYWLFHQLHNIPQWIYITQLTFIHTEIIIHANECMFK